jgi:hypothetical protein
MACTYAPCTTTTQKQLRCTAALVNSQCGRWGNANPDDFEADELAGVSVRERERV